MTAGTRALAVPVSRLAGGIRTPLFFLHLPKTAGTSVLRMIAQRFPLGRSKIDAGLKFADDPNDYDFVAGHYEFAFTERFRTRPLVLTFLRDPVARAVSMWKFAQLDMFADLATQAEPPRLKSVAMMLKCCRRSREMSLLQLLEREPELARPFLGNLQTAILMGKDFVETATVPTTTADLAEAQQCLERCDVIGLTEDFDRSMAWLARRMGWVDFGPAWVENVSRFQTTADALDPRAVEILTEWNRLDAALYAHAKKLIGERRDRHAPAAPAPLPSPHAYRFDQPIFGIGWHDREADARGAFCWTGREEESSLDLRAVAGAGDHRLTIQIAHTIYPDALAHLKLAVNGTALPTRLLPNGAEPVVEAHVPASVLAAGPERLRLSLRPGTRRHSADASTRKDMRLLGVAVRQIDFAPL